MHVCTHMGSVASLPSTECVGITTIDRVCGLAHTPVLVVCRITNIGKVCVSVYVYLCVCTCVRACVCVCVCVLTSACQLPDIPMWLCRP